jgi:hypothetical protein
MAISQLAVYSLLLASNMPQQDAQTMMCIIEKESNWNPKAINHHNKNKTKDYGLFQINTVNHKKCNMTPEELLHPRLNLKCALLVYKDQGLKAWSTYKKCKKPENRVDIAFLN